jgi:hypothetical protein
MTAIRLHVNVFEPSVRDASDDGPAKDAGAKSTPGLPAIMAFAMLAAMASGTRARRQP